MERWCLAQSLALGRLTAEVKDKHKTERVSSRTDQSPELCPRDLKNESQTSVG